MQRIVFTSTTKVEYIVLGYAARKPVWIRRFINKLKLEIFPEIELLGDNEISITLTKNT